MSGRVETAIENAVAIAEALKKAGFNVEVLLCGDMPCLHAYKKPTRDDAELLRKQKEECLR